VYLTAEQYATYTGDTAPSDFTVCLTLAEMLFDLHTQDYFSQTDDLTALPAAVQTRIKQAVAYQVQAISESGGVAGATDDGEQSVSLGKFSYTNAQGTKNALCEPTKALIAYLMAYVRGVQE